ncbi:MAG: class I SAM-dependent methyltransferase [Bdellovibrionaceae bacterium]|nr:class I SAM-dependent methyltransferase [Pseudobdellovibrionaceae bacterium]
MLNFKMTTLENLALPPRDYDLVGKYSQDEINGFSTEVIPSLINEVIKHNPGRVLDCMAGDGNLTSRFIQTLIEGQRPLPQIEILEFSSVQSQIARDALSAYSVRVWNGDVLTMKDLETKKDLFDDNTFDCVMLKSANHEIPRDLQTKLWGQIFRVLKPGGMLINLGFLFDEESTRDDVRRLALCKDELAGFSGAVSNRYFLLRKELIQFLHGAGFVRVQTLKKVMYNISAGRVAKNYFPRDFEKHQIFKDAILSSRNLRDFGYIEKQGDDIAFLAEGEITIAYKNLV